MSETGGPAQVATGSVSCPSCGAPVEFQNQRSVALVCEYCDTTVVREDRGDALENLGKVSHVVEDATPLRIGAQGECFGVSFRVIGRLQVVHDAGYWNEWFLQWQDGRTGWLGEALGQYFITFPTGKDGAEGDAPEFQAKDVPGYDELRVGQRIKLGRKVYFVTEKRRARVTGTQGETPFVTPNGYELAFADLRQGARSFATIDYSEDPPLCFEGQAVKWPDLNLRGYRRFDGWE